MGFLLPGLVVFLLGGTTLLKADHPGTEAVTAGVHAFYNYHFQEGVEILTRARQEYPLNPVVHFTWAVARWRYNEAHYTLEETRTRLQTDLEKVIPVYRDLVERFPDQPEYELFLGSAVGLRARVHLGRKEWLRTLIWAYRGFRYVQTAAGKDSTLQDASLPIGITEYYAGASNLLVKTAARLFGLEPSQPAGLEKIITAAEESKLAWIEARSLLSFIYLWVDPDPHEGWRHSRLLVEHFPNNFDFQIHYLESLLQNDSLAEAGGHLAVLDSTFRELNPVQQAWFGGYLGYEWAHYYYLRGDLERALEVLQESITSYGAELDMILGNAWLLKGQIHDLQGDRQAAVQAYRRCRSLRNLTRAMTAAQHYLQEPFQG